MPLPEFSDELVLMIARAAVPSVLLAKAIHRPGGGKADKIIAVNGGDFQVAIAFLSFSFSHSEILQEVRNSTTLRIESWLNGEEEGGDERKPNLPVDTSSFLRAIDKFEVRDMEFTALLAPGEEYSNDFITYLHPYMKHILRYTLALERDATRADKVLRKKILVHSYLTPDSRELSPCQWVPGALSSPWPSFIWVVNSALDVAQMIADYGDSTFADAFGDISIALSRSVNEKLELLKKMDIIYGPEPPKDKMQEWKRPYTVSVWSQMQGLIREHDWVKVHEEDMTNTSLAERRRERYGDEDE
ncbi:Hypothetical predicted protein [Lecanosticta acicola]|uniref:Uncharacterized protein n=1 Tax=Lecanosticta acicola TaxID=111012 RepID=A0AAI8YYI0_9PEZI|nr:Hypothetical predicted protein [Lecanosticta acicola]